MNSPSLAASFLLPLYVSSPFVSFPLSFYHLGILAWWVFVCFSLLVPTCIQGPNTRRGVWFALSCSDEASRPELRIPKRPLFVLRVARPLQLKFEDAGFVYVTMVWRGQTRQPSIDGRPFCLVEVLVCYSLLWFCSNRWQFQQAVWPVVPVRGPVYGRMHIPVVGETGTLLRPPARAVLRVIDKSSQARSGPGPRLGGG